MLVEPYRKKCSTPHVPFDPFDDPVHFFHPYYCMVTSSSCKLRAFRLWCHGSVLDTMPDVVQSAGAVHRAQRRVHCSQSARHTGGGPSGPPQSSLCHASLAPPPHAAAVRHDPSARVPAARRLVPVQSSARTLSDQPARTRPALQSRHIALVKTICIVQAAGA